MVEPNVGETDRHVPLSAGLLLFSCGFAFGAWYMDRHYIRRKFRVIIALDSLVAELTAGGGDAAKVSPELLMVSGDNGTRNYDCEGYRQARWAELAVYLTPLLVLISGVALFFRW